MTTQTLTLPEFLLARIAEDEEEARGYVADLDAHPPSAYDMEQVGWIEAGSPARVLAECEAKRRMVVDLSAEKHEVVEDCWHTCGAATEERDGGETCDDARRNGDCDCGRDARVGRRLALLATVYADHPDYDEAWRP